MKYYSHHIGDHLTETAHLSMLEDGAYRRLKDRYFTTEAPITANEPDLFRLIRARSEDEKEAVRTVLSEFFVLTETGWVHAKCDEEIANFQVKTEANRTNGLKGGRPKKEKEEPKQNPEITQSVSENNPDITLTNNHKPLNKKTPHTPQGGQGEGSGSEVPPASDVPQAKAKRASAISFRSYLERCKAEGVKPIPKDDPVFDYAASTGIPHEFLQLHWCEFRDRYSQPGAKQYRDWKSVFRKSVRGNWLRLWHFRDDAYMLTTQGQQAKKLHGELA